MEFDLRKYLRLVGQWWWLLVIGLIVPMGVSYYLVSQQPDLYQARTVLMVGTTLESANPDTTEMGISRYLARGYAEMVKFRPVTQQVIDGLGLEQTPDALAGQITAFVRPDANLLEIVVTDYSPEAAAAIANALADELIRQSPGSQTRGEQQQFVERQLEELKAKLEEVDKEIEEQTAELANLTSAAERQEAQENLNSLEALAARYHDSYTRYLDSYVGSSVNQLKIVEDATIPGSPTGKNRALILGVAGLAGLGLALAGVVLIQYLDDTLEWSNQQEELLFGLPVLGALGRMTVGKQALLERPQNRSPEAETLRALRTNVLFHRLEHPYRTLLITSPSSGEGKSFTAANLAAAMADAGLRVILVDADMRRPSQHTFFDVPNVVGLADLLQPGTPRQDIESRKALRETGAPNLRLLTAGQVPLDPTMLLMSPVFSKVVQSLSRDADIVLFDGPPVLLMADVSILASQIEAGILVAAHGVTTRGQLGKAIDNLKRGAKVDLLGVVFDQARLRESSYTYDYYAVKSKPSLPSWLTNTLRRLSLKREPELADDDPDRMLTVAEMAERLGIDRATVRRWGKTGRLPMVRRGLSWRVRQSDFQAMVAREILAGLWRK